LATVLWYVGVQDIQPLTVLHLGGDEVPGGALKKSPACRPLLDKYRGINFRLHFMKFAVDIAARLGIETVQVTCSCYFSLSL